MDLQETVESLRKVIEGAVAPSIRDMQTRLSGVEKGSGELREEMRDMRGEMRDLNTRMDAGMAELRGEMRDLNTRMDAGMAELRGEMRDLNTRMDAGMAELRGEIRGVNSRFDTLMAAILNIRQPSYPDSVLSRLEQLEKSLQEVSKNR